MTECPRLSRGASLVSLQTLCVESVKIIAAQVLIPPARALKVISDHQNAVGNDDDGALPTSANGKPPKLSGGICILCGEPQPREIDKPYDATTDCLCESCC